MNFDKVFNRLRVKVRGAQDEISLAIMLHETWRPTAYDRELHDRMGDSYATNSFYIVRQSLRREMLLSLMKIWDKDNRTIEISAISNKLQCEEFFNSLVESRAVGRRPSMFVEVREVLEPMRDAVLELVGKYSEGGAEYDVFKRLHDLRNKRLAHRQVTSSSATYAETTDVEIESFYQDNLKLVQLLISLILSTSLDFNDAANVYRGHAKLFWANARGERTEGHPNYRSPQGLDLLAGRVGSP